MYLIPDLTPEDLGRRQNLINASTPGKLFSKLMVNHGGKPGFVSAGISRSTCFIGEENTLLKGVAWIFICVISMFPVCLVLWLHEQSAFFFFNKNESVYLT